MNARVLETIKKSAAVPSMPQVVMRFLEIMQDPEFDYKDLERVLSADPGTVSEVLRLANSALFGVRNKVVSVRHALTLLGPKRTRSLLLGRYLVDTMSKRGVAGLDMGYFWRRSLASSAIASHLGWRVLPKFRDECFIAALLAKIGVPILAEALPQKYAKIAAQLTPDGTPITLDQEVQAVEVTHAEVSAMVLAHWTLPDNVCSAVNLHLSNNPGEGDVSMMARVLNSSDRVARLLCGHTNALEVATVSGEAMAFIGLDVAALVALLPKIEKDLGDLAEALRIELVLDERFQFVAAALGAALVESAV